MNTTTTPTIFQFNTHEVRAIVKDGEPWFVASDVCLTLGYRDSANGMRCLDDDEKGTHIVSTLGGNQKLTIINESGLYSLVLRSRKPEARKFSKWVTSEVLPAIRKTGSYAVAPAAQDNTPAPRRNLRWVNDEKDIDRRIHVRAWQLAGLFMDKWISDMHAESQYHSFMANDHAVEAWTPSFGSTDAIETLDMLASMVAGMSESVRAKGSDMTKLLEASINMNCYETRRAA